jgi:hypothetical protein
MAPNFERALNLKRMAMVIFQELPGDRHEAELVISYLHELNQWQHKIEEDVRPVLKAMGGSR